jgi:hypothetical protein
MSHAANASSPIAGLRDRSATIGITWQVVDTRLIEKSKLSVLCSFLVGREHSRSEVAIEIPPITQDFVA